MHYFPLKEESAYGTNDALFGCRSADVEWDGGPCANDGANDGPDAGGGWNQQDAGLRPSGRWSVCGDIREQERNRLCFGGDRTECGTEPVCGFQESESGRSDCGSHDRGNQNGWTSRDPKGNETRWACDASQCAIKGRRRLGVSDAV